MASAFLERTRFSLFWRDWIGCVPEGTLISKGCIEHTQYPVRITKCVRVFCECREERVDSTRVPTSGV